MRLETDYPETEVWFDLPIDSAFEALLTRRQARRIAVFTGRRAVDENGIWRNFEGYLRDRSVERFREIEPEPTVATVRRMVDFLKRGNFDTVIALGGGSVMDAAKAAYLAFQASCGVEELFGVESGPVETLQQWDRVICFPTTSGTGSEVTPYANLVDPEKGVKKLISTQAIIPAHAFVLPLYAMTMPPTVTLATGCDALAHLIEGFLNVGADARDPAANARALAGIGILVRNFPAALADGTDRRARSAMALAATLGGMTIRHKSTGLPHLCSFSWFGRIEHGLAVALLLPACWRYYLANPAVAARTMELASVFPGTTPEEVIASCRAFLTRCGVPGSLSAFPALTPELLEATARSGSENAMKLELAPQPVPVDQSYEVLRDILARS